MRLFFFTLPILFFNFPQAIAQDTLPLHYSKSISKTQLKKDVRVLSSDNMEGRETGSKGQKLAARYIYQQFANAKLPNQFEGKDSLGYFQNFLVYKQKQAKANILVDGKQLQNYEDILISGFADYSNENMELVFLGTAPDSSFTNKNFSNKAVFFLSTNLYAGAIKSNNIVLNSGAKMVLFCNPNQPNQYKQLVAKKKTTASQTFKLNPKNSKVNPFDSIAFSKSFLQHKIRTKTYQGAVSIFAASALLNLKPKELKKIMAGKKTKNAHPLIRKINFGFQLNYDKFPTENVLAFLPGTDQKDEYLIVSAHYDHIGKNNAEIFNGANDNASGTASLLEIARKFQQAREKGHRTKRSILFVAFTGEEKGLLGSEYFISNTFIPMNKIIGNLNLDMLGRHDEQSDNDDYIYLLGAGHLNPKLKVISDSINQIFPKLRLDYKYDSPNNFLYMASDQASFVKRGIPAIFYFNGLHKDYHRPTDTAEKINYESVRKVTQLVFLTAWELANKKHSK